MHICIIYLKSVLLQHKIKKLRNRLHAIHHDPEKTISIQEQIDRLKMRQYALTVS